MAILLRLAIQVEDDLTARPLGYAVYGQGGRPLLASVALGDQERRPSVDHAVLCIVQTWLATHGHQVAF